MSLKRVLRGARTTTFRLTAWYLSVFTALSTAAFAVAYLSLASYLHVQSDHRVAEISEAFSLLYRQHGREALASEFGREAQSRGTRRVFFLLLSPDQRTLASSDLAAWRGLLRPPQASWDAALRGRRVFFGFRTPDGRRVKALLRPVGGGRVLEVGGSFAGEARVLRRYREAFAAGLAAMLLCGSLAGWLLARRAMAGVRRVTEAAERVGKFDLKRRVPSGGEGLEIEALAHAFNAMVERIGVLLEELRQVTDNVAHELRTPLTRIRAAAETALSPGGGVDWRDAAATVVGSCDQLTGMINTMLEIARAGSAPAWESGTTVDLAALAEDAADLFAPVAEAKGVALRLPRGKAPVPVAGDRARLQRVVANLLDNALKFTPPGGEVRLEPSAAAGWARLDVSDTGPGIAPGDLPRVFERFYRADRARATAGSGLGLSLARALARAHGGDVTAESSPRGSVFSLRLPAAPPGAPPQDPRNLAKE